MSRPTVLLSWSSGKDCAWALHVLRRRGDVEVVGLLTTFNEAADRAAMHAVRRRLVEAQAEAAGLPLRSVSLPYPCSNEDYEARMAAATAETVRAGVTHVAFGDLFLEDVRDYRIRQMAGTGLEPLFPLWGASDETPALAREMLNAGIGAILTCVDPKQLEPKFVGRRFDEALLAELPPGVDPCGERGEFHTFCHRSPEFRRDIPVEVGEVVQRDGFWFADLDSPARGEGDAALGFEAPRSQPAPGDVRSPEAARASRGGAQASDGSRGSTAADAPSRTASRTAPP